jgi:hypothetical protein
MFENFPQISSIDSFLSHTLFSKRLHKDPNIGLSWAIAAVLFSMDPTKQDTLLLVG